MRWPQKFTQCTQVVLTYLVPESVVPGSAVAAAAACAMTGSCTPAQAAPASAPVPLRKLRLFKNIWDCSSATVWCFRNRGRDTGEGFSGTGLCRSSAIIRSREACGIEPKPAPRVECVANYLSIVCQRVAGVRFRSISGCRHRQRTRIRKCRRRSIGLPRGHREWRGRCGIRDAGHRTVTKPAVGLRKLTGVNDSRLGYALATLGLAAFSVSDRRSRPDPKRVQHKNQMIEDPRKSHEDPATTHERSVGGLSARVALRNPASPGERARADARTLAVRYHAPSSWSIRPISPTDGRPISRSDSNAPCSSCAARVMSRSRTSYSMASSTPAGSAASPMSSTAPV
jgi:hypothetical protein